MQFTKVQKNLFCEIALSMHCLSGLSNDIRAQFFILVRSQPSGKPSELNAEDSSRWLELKDMNKAYHMETASATSSRAQLTWTALLQYLIHLILFLILSCSFSSWSCSTSVILRCVLFFLVAEGLVTEGLSLLADSACGPSLNWKSSSLNTSTSGVPGMLMLYLTCLIIALKFMLFSMEAELLTSIKVCGSE